MVRVIDVLSKLRKGVELSEEENRKLPNLKAETVQQGAVLAGLIPRGRSSSSSAAHYAHQSETLTVLYKAARGVQTQLLLRGHSPEVVRRWSRVLSRIKEGTRVGSRDISSCVTDIVRSAVPNEFVGAFLMLVCRFGLQDRDVLELTGAMSGSGETFDYREDRRLHGKRMFRRYPTGGVSEKVSLILPSVIAALGEDRPLVSPFLVARSLGFTGGTWDKLSSIPGFRFPEPGGETVETLVQCGVAMSVTHGSFNPADRILYQMRSVTETIESDPLIISSIVSKQIGVPCDLLILDVRYGSGAFLGKKEQAAKIGKAMCELIQKFGIKCIMTLLDTSEPNGVTIGNALEVSEAITVMKNETIDEFDVRMQRAQRNIVIDFAAKGMAYLFPDYSPGQWAVICEDKFANGDVWRHFKSLLRAHHVGQDTIDELESDSLFLVRNCPQYEVRARKSGQISALDQEALGRIVNFELGGGGNEYAGSRDLYAGIILERRLYDFVRRGETIARVVSNSEGAELVARRVSRAFDIN